ncbi:unnamed protein product [Thlaspi arvense]|uniref:Uncharacterized protein n=1 Tax=Thlaspi arvense TaxID=13288 RepID=A0AAU9S0I0_THLAR|nr:unnamed protein product [Thlaspi arvense]
MEMHLCMVPKTPGRPHVVGILTRHDLMLEHILGLYPHINPHNYCNWRLCGFLAWKPMMMEDKVSPVHMAMKI